MRSRTLIAAVLAALALLPAAPASGQPGPALNCADPASQAEMNMCAEIDFEAADKELNAVYRKAIAQFHEQDVSYAEEGPDYVGAEKLLRESQRAWLDSRDCLCGARSLTFYGGSMRPAVQFSCLAMITRSRTEELRWLLDE